jgi:cytochrome c oxidase subunit 4
MPERTITSETIVPLRTYYLIFAALIVLALATTAISFVDLGIFNTVVAMTIAGIKAALVVLFFMHVRYEHRLVSVVVIACVSWLIILLLLTTGDYLTRGWLPAPSKLPPVHL